MLPMVPPRIIHSRPTPRPRAARTTATARCGTPSSPPRSRARLSSPTHRYQESWPVPQKASPGGNEIAATRLDLEVGSSALQLFLSVLGPLSPVMESYPLAPEVTAKPIVVAVAASPSAPSQNLPASPLSVSPANASRHRELNHKDSFGGNLAAFGTPVQVISKGSRLATIEDQPSPLTEEPPSPTSATASPPAVQRAQASTFSSHNRDAAPLRHERQLSTSQSNDLFQGSHCCAAHNQEQKCFDRIQAGGVTIAKAYAFTRLAHGSGTGTTIHPSEQRAS